MNVVRFLCCVGILLAASSAPAMPLAGGRSGTLAPVPVQVSRELRLRKDSLPSLLRSLAPSGVSVTRDAAREAEGERVSLYCRGLPTRDVARHVATLYGWERQSGDNGGFGPSEAHLVRERRREYALSDAAFLPVLAKVRADRETRPARVRAARAALAAADERMREQRELELVALDSRSAAYDFYPTLSRPQRRQLLEEYRLFLPWARLTAQQRELAGALVRAAAFIEPDPWAVGGRTPDQPVTVGERAEQLRKSTAHLARTGVTLSVTTEPVTGVVLRLGVDVAGAGGYGIVPGPAELAEYERALPPVRGDPYVAKPSGEDGGVAPAVAAGAAYEELEQLPFPREVRLAEEDAWGDVLAKLAPALGGRPVFSDGYAAARGIRPALGPLGTALVPLSPPPADRLTGAASLAAGLDLLCGAYNMLWWAGEDGALYFRSRTWPVERRYEVPAAVRARLRDDMNAARAPSGLSASALPLLGELTVAQLQGLTGTGDPKEETGFIDSKIERVESAPLARALFQLFARLDAGQQRAALTRPGLPDAAMSEAQLAALAGAVVPVRGAEFLDDAGNMRFLVESYRLPPRPRRRRGAPPLTAAGIRIRFTSDNNTVPCHFAVVVEEERTSPREGGTRSAD